MLAICARFSNDDWAGMDTVWESLSVPGARLAIALHFELLDVGREAEQGLTVRQDGSRLDPANVSIVEADKTHHCD